VLLLNDGAIDVIVVKQKDGSFKSSPIHLDFGKSDYVLPLQVTVEGKKVNINKMQFISNAKTYKFTSDDINEMSLKQGANLVEYSIKPADSRHRIKLYSFIYLWNFNDKIVVSDIDGTITKSDLKGFIYGFINKINEWCHSGVIKLFSKIENHSYKFIYLSARPRGLKTRKLLEEINQNGKILPNGPILLNPCNILNGIHQHYMNKSHKFKISYLKKIIELFLVNLIVAGFGNQSTDQIAYKKCGIPHIFLINQKSELVFNSTKSSYDGLADDAIFHEIFPPLKN
jgi:phosphatidate phosphatase LPIN